MTIPATPLVVRPVVSHDQEFFFGRRRQLNTLSNILRYPHGLSLSVIGLRRAGKTSLLHEVMAQAKGMTSPTPLPTLIAYLDLSSITLTRAGFFAAVASKVFETLGRPAPTSAMADFQWLRHALQDVLRDYRIVMMLDEFEALITSSEFDVTFFESLRSLTQDPHIDFRWVTASRRPLKKLLDGAGKMSSVGASGFPNVFQVVVVAGLEPEAQRELVGCVATRAGLTVTEEEVVAICSLAGSFPFFLRRTADAWLETRQPGMSTEAVRALVLSELLGPLSEVRQMFDSYWHHLAQAPRECWRRAAEGKIASVTGDAANTLADYGLILKQEGKITANGELMGQYLTSRCDEYDVFISYSHADAEWVTNTLLPRLVDGGLNVCIDCLDFQLGTPILTNITAAIRSSLKTLLVLSPNWLRSPWTLWEAEQALIQDMHGGQRRIIPIMIEPCDPPDYLKPLIYLELSRDEDAHSYNFARLLRALGAHSMAA